MVQHHPPLILWLFLSVVLAGCGNAAPVNPGSSNSNQPLSVSTSTSEAALLCPLPRAETDKAVGTPVSRTLSPVPQIELERLAGNFDRPLAVTHAGDGSNRIFVVEKGGVIKIIREGATLAQPFLDLEHLVGARGSEQGLLGMAFHPNYARNGLFVVNYTDVNGDTVVATYHVSSDPDSADLDSAETLLTIGQPASNHNGGHLAFGPDGYLYIGMGDGGAAGDPWNHGQRCDTLLGKLLRIDLATDGTQPYSIPPDNPLVNQPGMRPEIWAWGLRNPWRFSFDPQGNLYIADVGQNQYEEIDYAPAGTGGGKNYGWRMREGTSCYANDQTCELQGLAPPVLVYSHEGGHCSITGGTIYRGTAFPNLQGIYWYGDYCSGTIWALSKRDNAWESALVVESNLNISSFGEDESGELYVADVNGGGIYRIVEKKSEKG